VGTRFLEKLPDKKVVAHFHEWMAGIAALYLKMANARIPTVFTTHATMLGRTVAGNGEPLYDELESMDPKEKAYRFGVQAKYLTEKAIAEKFWMPTVLPAMKVRI